MRALLTKLRSLIPYPKSMLGLVLTGFILVALLLLTAIVFAIVSVDRVTIHSGQTVVQGIHLIRSSRELEETITQMERSARQYLVVGEPGLFETYQEHQQNFLQILDDLEEVTIEASAEWDFDQMRNDNDAITRAVYYGNNMRSDLLESELLRFRWLRREAGVVSEDANTFIENRLDKLRKVSDRARAFLLFSNAALVVTASLLIVVFTVLITRPIRQMETAIHRLGRGEFDQPIKITGPYTEIRELASQLDWLRCRLTELEAEKRRFLQGVSHELKTPLASMREGTELLLDGTAGSLSQDQREIIDILHLSGLELQALIENLLNLTALRPTFWQLKYDRFIFHDLVTEVLRRHQLSIHKKSLCIVEPDTSLEVYADRERVRLVLDNLIANAIKFSPDGGTVSVNAAIDSNHVVIEVIDEGPGIPEDEHDSVFTPFYRGQHDRGSQVYGTGIGLAVVHESVQRHGGEVIIVNGKTSGTCFRITLPQSGTTS